MLERERFAAGRSSFGTLLRERRLAAGLSQEALAARAGLSVESIGALERGTHRAPHRGNLLRLYEALELDAAERRELEAAATQTAQPRAVGRPSLRRPDTNLPSYLTRLVGRADEIREIVALSRANRLLTLVGSGGIGKTRCATEAGRAMLESWRDGVWFIDLAPLRDPKLVGRAIATALGVTESPRRSTLEALTGALRNKSLLLILDNCEHVSLEAAGCAETILRGCPAVRVVATSRTSLGVGGEYTYRIPSLAVPLDRTQRGASESLTFGAVALFVERAQAVDSHFDWSDRTSVSVANICRRLDGIPLAIELAAARSNLLSAKQLLDQLHKRFELLVGGSRTALPRQQTMRALIDWSYDLLSPAERLLFERLSIFAGGCTLEAAASVCSGDGLEADGILDSLCTLVDSSLLTVESTTGSSRYDMLESLREYARERLLQRGELEWLSRHHAEWMADFADRAVKVLRSTPVHKWHARDELANARAAMSWSLENDPITAGRILGGLIPLWRGHQAEGRELAERTLQRLGADVPPALEALLWRGLANIVSAKRKVDAAERAVALYETLGDRGGLSAALYVLSTGLFQAQRLAEADATSERALQLEGELNPTGSRLFAHGLKLRAYFAMQQGALDQSRALLMRARDLYAALGEDLDAADTAGQLAEVEFASGDAEAALARASEGIDALDRLENTATLRRTDDNRKRSILLGSAAAYSLILGRVDEAHSWAAEAVHAALDCQDEMEILGGLQHLATVAAFRQDATRAARVLGYVDARFKDEGGFRQSTEQKTYEMAVARLRTSLTSDEICALAEQGARLSEEEAVAEALG